MSAEITAADEWLHDGQPSHDEGPTDLTATSDDTQASGVHRPQRMAQFVGQRKVMDNLEVFIAAAQDRGKPLDHMLLHGPPGLGKTTLARITANEMQAELRITSGPALARVGDLAAILTSLTQASVLFVDEVHRLPLAVEETLYAAMEDFRLDIVIGEGPGARTVRLDLPHFTFIGATTRAGMLSTPFFDRFGIVLELDFYDINELVAIIDRKARQTGIAITAQGAHEVARRGRGTPRVALRLLRRVGDFARVARAQTITPDIADHALGALGVDSQGLGRLDRSYLDRLARHYGGGPVGVATLASALHASRDTLETVVEPYLIRLGLIVRSPRGRMLSVLGRQKMQLPPQADTPHLPLSSSSSSSVASSGAESSQGATPTGDDTVLPLSG